MASSCVNQIDEVLDYDVCSECAVQEGDSPAASICLPGVPATAPMRESVRVATIDNFQGEESTVIILSLVRNNKCETSEISCIWAMGCTP